MGLVRFKPARRSDGSVEVRQMLPEGSATIAIGAPLTRDGTYTDQVEEHPGTSTVTGILGVAGAVATSGTPAFGTQIPVYIANQDTEFVGQIYDVSATAVQTVTTTVGTWEGNEYGMIEVSGEWYIDEEDTTHKVLRVTKELPEMNAVLFKFMAAAIQD